MQYLCSLGILILLSSIDALAEPPSFGVNLSGTNATGSTFINLTNDAIFGSSNTLELRQSSGLVNNKFRIRTGYLSSWTDLSSYWITERNGGQTHLADTFDGHQHSMAIGGDWLQKDLTLSLDINGTISETPLDQRQALFSIKKTNIQSGSDIEVSYSLTKQSRPISYFTDPDDFSTKASAPYLNPSVLKILYGKIITEKLKTSSFLLIGQRPEDRPNHFGMGFHSAYLLNDYLALHSGLELYAEDKRIALVDSRGYFDLFSANIGIAFEPAYRWLIRAGVGTSVETETERGTVPRQLVGTDSAQLTIEYRKSKILLLFTARLQQSNTHFEEHQFSGGITWEI